MKTSSPDPLTRVLQQVLDRTSDHRVVVIVTHGLVELAINTIVETYCKHGKKITNDHRSYSHGTKLLLLHEMGVLPNGYYEILDRLRRLRNRAAHEAVFVVDAAALKHLSEPFAKHLPTDLGGIASPTENLNVLISVEN